MSDESLQKLQKSLLYIAYDQIAEEENGRPKLRAEDAICAMCAIIAERCIDATGECNLRQHTLTPGQRIVSSRINELLVGSIDSARSGGYPESSVFGSLFASIAAKQLFSASALPDINKVFRDFSDRVAGHTEWGSVPLSAPPDHLPRFLPLRLAYESRTAVEALLAPLQPDKLGILQVAVGALILLLEQMRNVMDPKVMLLLCAELINGLAKTAPMSDRAMQELIADSQKEARH